MTNINALFYQQTGFDFEDEFFRIISETLDCTRASKEQDTKQGTDFFIEGIPADVTFNFSGKNYTKKVATFGDWSIGVRTANGRRQFETPVLVIGMDCEPFYVRDCIIPRMRSEIGDIQAFADIISDAYWEFIDNQ